MIASEIKSAIAAGLSEKAAEYWQNTTEQNEYVVLAQREGVDSAIAAVEELAAD